MKIAKALKDYDPDKLLKVGAKNGSGFFYCGTVGDFLENMEDNSDLLRKHAISILQAAKRRLNQRISNPPTIDRFTREQLRGDGNPNLTFQNYRFYVEHWFSGVYGLKQAADNHEQRYDAFKPLDKRDVVEVRESLAAADPGVTALIIEGYELGRYWTMDEAAGKSYIAFANEVEDDDDSTEESL